jgi:hypothetical protein
MGIACVLCSHNSIGMIDDFCQIRADRTSSVHVVRLKTNGVEVYTG